jgi:hypothetical protein
MYSSIVYILTYPPSLSQFLFSKIQVADIHYFCLERTHTKEFLLNLQARFRWLLETLNCIFLTNQSSIKLPPSLLFSPYSRIYLHQTMNEYCIFAFMIDSQTATIHLPKHELKSMTLFSFFFIFSHFVSYL